VKLCLGVSRLTSPYIPLTGDQLSCNYRSYGGIAYCAHSVIELITQFLAYAIDGSKARCCGWPETRFLSGWDKDTGQYVSLSSVVSTAFNPFLLQERFLFGAS
jgi:hypothetical protein